MKRILNLNDITDTTQLVNLLDNKTLCIYEDIQGSKIYVNWNGTDFVIKPKSLSNDILNIIDLTIQKYYESVIVMFNSLPDRIKDLFPKNWWFCFEYFPDEQPANIQYDRMPKNGLILIGIVKEESKNKKSWSVRWEELKEWADLLKVDVTPIIFKGKLTKEQIDKITQFVNTTSNDLEFIFDENNFSKFFYKLLNPDETSSFLMVNKYQENAEKLIISILETDEILSFQLLNPLYQKICPTDKTEHIEIYSLILLKFMEWIQSKNLASIKLEGSTVYDLYLNLMCKLWNNWVTTYLIDVSELQFDIPKFFKDDKFKVNINNIKNAKTRALLVKDEKYEYLFKVIVGSFFKHRYKEIGLFSKQTLNVFNSIVDMVARIIDNHFNISSEIELKKKGFLTFNDFDNTNVAINYDIDVYDAFAEKK